MHEHQIPIEMPAWTPDQVESAAAITASVMQPDDPRLKEPLTPVRRQKASYVGAPAIFALELECKHLNAAFDGFGCYLVGSALDRADWRDVDVRLIMADDKFYALFPDVPRIQAGLWEHDPRWLLMTAALSERLSRITGLPIDFQFQPQTHANKMHDGPRSALGLNFVRHDSDG
jgi:hypothetical protein